MADITSIVLPAFKRVPSVMLTMKFEFSMRAQIATHLDARHSD
jgi:hypothetical protein